MANSSQLLLGIDLGTTQTKTGLFDLDGNLRALARAGYPIIAGEKIGWAEQDPEAWWVALKQTVREVLTAAEGEIVAVCCGGQSPTLVMSDADGNPLYNALLWMDTRAQTEQAELVERIGPAAGPWSVLPRALWLKRHHTEQYERARWFLSAFDFLAFRLCGRAANSVPWGRGGTEAQTLEQATLNPALFPPAVTIGSVIGHVTPQAAREVGLPAGLPVVAGVNDGTETFLGAGLIKPGLAVDTGGTSGGFGLCWHSPLNSPGLIGGGGLLPDQFICGGAMAATGKSLDWFRENILGDTQNVEELIASAEAIPAGAEGLLFLPYLNGERSPHWDPTARGVFVGLTLRHQRGHMARAILEGAAFTLRDIAQRALDEGAQVSEMRVCGGPARSKVWNQIKADVLGFPITVPRVPEAAVLGAAILAGLGADVFPDVTSGIQRMVHVAQRLEAQPANHERYNHLFPLYRDLYIRLSPVFKALANA